MCYRRFLLFNVIGAVAWSVAVVAAGNVLGMVSVVNRDLTLLIYGVKALTAESIKCIILPDRPRISPAPRRLTSVAPPRPIQIY